MAEIRTNIPLTPRQAVTYKKLKNLSTDSEPLPQGDGIIRISPFDDYVSFTLYEKRDGENVPIDLSNVGSLYISFIGENDEIRIKNFTNAQEIDYAGGQVVFRIDTESSKRILELDNDNFYISSVYEDPNGDSDESVLYTGKFLSITDAAEQSLTSQINELNLQYTKEIDTLQTENAALRKKVEELSQTVSQLESSLGNLTSDNNQLANELNEFAKNSPNFRAAKLQKQAAQNVAIADQNRKQAQTAGLLQEQTKGKPTKKRAEILSKGLEKYS
tara:strand:+ start:9876 stop:10697 length:822 start_codon:yes stop_codon:yes gene_type:complete